MSSHTSYDLIQMQSLPLRAKIQMTKQRIRQWYDYWGGNVYVSVSGGKDSTVLADIVKSMYDDVPIVFCNTGLEFDSVRERAIELSDKVLKPKLSFVQTITKYGYPIISKEVSEVLKDCQRAKLLGKPMPDYRLKRLTGELINPKTGQKSRFCIDKYKFLLDAPFRISNECCTIMKKRPAHSYAKETDRKAILGTMASESALRYQKWLKFGCNAYEQAGNPTSSPMSFWTDNDVLEYIYTYNIKIASIYGDIVKNKNHKTLVDIQSRDTYETTGAKRTGCVFCLFGITRDINRLLKLKEAEPKKYDYVMGGGKFDDLGMWIPDKGLGYKFVIDWLNEHGNLGIKY